MKLIPYVEDAKVIDAHGNPVMVKVKQGDESVKEEQLTLPQRELFLQRLEDPMAVQGMAPLKASKFINKIYDAIAEQTDEIVKARGGWKFEDAHADAICKVVKAGPSPTKENPLGGYPMFLIRVIGPMLEAVEPENVKEWKDPVLEKVTNGATEKFADDGPAPAIEATA